VPNPSTTTAVSDSQGRTPCSNWWAARRGRSSAAARA